MFLTVLIGVMIAGLLGYLFFLQRKSTTIEKTGKQGSNALSLQAYERLTLLVDRIALPNLISRMTHEGLSARDMQAILTKNIRDEFDYNITQQIYVSPESWNAVKNLKEKNMLLVNHIAAGLPTGASGLDLGKAILEYIMQDSKADVHELVSQALSYEAKKHL